MRWLVLWRVLRSRLWLLERHAVAARERQRQQQWEEKAQKQARQARDTERKQHCGLIWGWKRL